MQKNLIGGAVAAAMLALTSMSVGAADKPDERAGVPTPEKGKPAPRKPETTQPKGKPVAGDPAPSAQTQAPQPPQGPMKDRAHQPPPDASVEGAPTKGIVGSEPKDGGKKPQAPLDAKAADRMAKEQAVKDARLKEQEARRAENAAKGGGQKPQVNEKK